MITSFENLSIAQTNHKITYEITRWDIFFNFLTVLFRNRILQVFFIGFMLYNIWIIAGPIMRNLPLASIVFVIVEIILGFAAFLMFFQAILGLAMAFLPKHRGVVGQHILEITEEGFIERTDYNETQYKWESISRISSLFGSLYIYVSDTNAHQIPKRYFSRQEFIDFKTELQAYVKRYGSH